MSVHRKSSTWTTFSQLNNSVRVTIEIKNGGREMDNMVLKKRLSTFRTAKGNLSKISDDVIMEVFRAWEQWSGTAKEFYQGIGLKKHQLANIVKKGKRLVKSGIVSENEFSEIKVEAAVNNEVITCGDKIVLKWEKGNVIHFTQVDQLIDFLKKVA